MAIFFHAFEAPLKRNQEGFQTIFGADLFAAGKIPGRIRYGHFRNTVTEAQKFAGNFRLPAEIIIFKFKIPDQIPAESFVASGFIRKVHAKKYIDKPRYRQTAQIKTPIRKGIAFLPLPRTVNHRTIPGKDRRNALIEIIGIYI